MFYNLTFTKENFNIRNAFHIISDILTMEITFQEREKYFHD